MGATASSSNFRYRRSSAGVHIPAPASVAIEVGDLLYRNDTGNGPNGSSQGYPANAKSWNASLGQTQVDFRALFVGVSNDKRLVGDASTDQEIVAIPEGIFEYPCAALGAAHHIGEFVGPDKDAGGNFLYNQQLAIVADAAHAIGVLAEEAANGATTLVVRLQSFLFYGGLSS
jgi:hypothetical protein